MEWLSRYIKWKKAIYVKWKIYYTKEYKQYATICVKDEVKEMCVCVCLYMHKIIRIIKIASRKGNWMAGGGNWRIFAVYSFILVEFWTVWIYDPFWKLVNSMIALR